MSEVAEDMKAIFEVKPLGQGALVEGFVEFNRGRFPKAISVFEAGIGEARTHPLP